MNEEDEYKGVGLASRMGSGGVARTIAYVAVAAMLIPVVLGIMSLLS